MRVLILDVERGRTFPAVIAAGRVLELPLTTIQHEIMQRALQMALVKPAPVKRNKRPGWRRR